MIVAQQTKAHDCKFPANALAVRYRSHHIHPTQISQCWLCSIRLQYELKLLKSPRRKQHNPDIPVKSQRPQFVRLPNCNIPISTGFSMLQLGHYDSAAPLPDPEAIFFHCFSMVAGYVLVSAGNASVWHALTAYSSPPKALSSSPTIVQSFWSSAFFCPSIFSLAVERADSSLARSSGFILVIAAFKRGQRWLRSLGVGLFPVISSHSASISFQLWPA